MLWQDRMIGDKIALPLWVKRFGKVLLQPFSKKLVPGETLESKQFLRYGMPDQGYQTIMKYIFCKVILSVH